MALRCCYRLFVWMYCLPLTAHIMVQAREQEKVIQVVDVVEMKEGVEGSAAASSSSSSTSLQPSSSGPPTIENHQPTVEHHHPTVDHQPLPQLRYQKALRPEERQGNLPDEQRLLNYIMRGYEKSVRPVRNASTPVVIRMGLTLTQIFDMDEKDQVLVTNVWLDQEWVDEFLVWDPMDFNNITMLRIPCHKIWLPDIVLYNNAAEYTDGLMPANAMIDHTGNVFWPVPTKLQSSCKVDVTYFPFDYQTCKLKFGSWTYDGYQVDITNRTTEVDLSNYVVNGEWELIYIRIVRNVVRYACCDEPFPDVTFYVSSSLARRIALTLWQNPASNAVLHVQCCLPLRHDVGADAAGVLPPARQRREDRPGHHRATGLLRLHAGRGREPPRNLRVRAPHQYLSDHRDVLDLHISDHDGVCAQPPSPRPRQARHSALAARAVHGQRAHSQLFHEPPQLQLRRQRRRRPSDAQHVPQGDLGEPGPRAARGDVRGEWGASGGGWARRLFRCARASVAASLSAVRPCHFSAAPASASATATATASAAANVFQSIALRSVPARLRRPPAGAARAPTVLPGPVAATTAAAAVARRSCSRPRLPARPQQTSTSTFAPAEPTTATAGARQLPQEERALLRGRADVPHAHPGAPRARRARIRVRAGVATPGPDCRPHPFLLLSLPHRRFHSGHPRHHTCCTGMRTSAPHKSQNSCTSIIRTAAQ